MLKVTERDKRVLKVGVVCVLLIAAYKFGPGIHGRWKEARSELAELETSLAAIDVEKSRRAGLLARVPVFEMPEEEEKQKYIFRKEFDEQLKKSGVGPEKPLQFQSTRKSPRVGYKLLPVQCSAKCNFGQALDLLARLNENKYLVGVEEFKMECDAKKPQEVKLDLTVSTLVR